jgi:hypothetical protein
VADLEATIAALKVQVEDTEAIISPERMWRTELTQTKF